jgi:excisionase family DNA binding protein
MPDLPLGEAARRLGLSPATLRWQIKNGKLQAYKVGPLWMLSEDELDRYGRDSLRVPLPPSRSAARDDLLARGMRLPGVADVLEAYGRLNRQPNRLQRVAETFRYATGGNE